MDFYKTKKVMQEQIKKMLEAGVKEEDICFAITEASGFGKNFSTKYIAELKTRGFGATQ